MTLSLFDQFMSPTLLGIPLMPLAIALPSILILTFSPRWLNNRLLILQTWFINMATRQLFLPINVAGHKWALMFTSLMIFLISLNTLGLLPYTFTPTTQLSLTLSLAVPLWLMTVITGMRYKPTPSLAHLLPEGTPIPLIPALIIIETISLLIRPFALAVRIAANLTAGHLLIHLISTAAMVLLPVSTMLTLSMMTLLYLLTFLEMAVAMLQAFVFVLLLTLYLQESI